MKVKMFTNMGDVTKLENEVNEWFRTNAVKIHFIEQSYTFSSSIGGGLNTLISIWYT